ncbi:MAG TPA: DUF3419 family protein, partial [Abditibacteriaceae bacterium]|nr:DUF3419 family protein [Abditibacteriaceae bacterium]
MRSKSAAALWSSGTLGKQPQREPRIVFAQVHEDAVVEVAAFARSHPGSPARIAFAIGSGGCTAFSLLCERPSHLHIIDINAAQIFLIEIKKAAIQTLQRDDVLSCFHDDARPFYARLRPHLTLYAQSFWDTRSALLACGLSQCGVIERNLRRLACWLPLLQRRHRVATMFRQTDLQKQRALYRHAWDNWRWKMAFTLVLSKPVLRLLYARHFIAAVPPDFARLMKQRVDEIFTRFATADNGYLWQTLRGHYPPRETALPLYLRAANFEIVKSGLQSTTLQHADAAAWLATQAPASIDFFALSNILEVTTPEYS